MSSVQRVEALFCHKARSKKTYRLTALGARLLEFAAWFLHQVYPTYLAARYPPHSVESQIDWVLDRGSSGCDA